MLLIILAACLILTSCEQPEVIKNITVSFYDGAKLIQSVEILPETACNFPAAPEKLGYNFDGWKLGDSLIPLDQKTFSLPYSNTEYRYEATWSPKSLAVSFYDGEELLSSDTAYTDTAKAFPAAPSKTGYTFAGWKIGDELISSMRLHMHSHMLKLDTSSRLLGHRSP